MKATRLTLIIAAALSLGLAIFASVRAHTTTPLHSSIRVADDSDFSAAGDGPSDTDSSGGNDSGT